MSNNLPPRQVCDQLEWIQRLRKRGYHVLTLWDSVDAVINAINAYLEDA